MQARGRAPLVACLAVVSFLAGLTGVRLAYTLAYALVGLLIITYGWTKAVSRRLDVQRDSPEGAAMVGEPFVERFTLTNRSPLPIAYCEVHDGTDLPGYQPGRACSLRGGELVRWSARGVFPRRGRYGFGPLEVRLGDPFGLFVRRVGLVASEPVLVHPQVSFLGEIGSMGSSVSGTDAQRGRSLDLPPDVGTVREYDPGDGLTRIHWPTTARTGRLMSRVYDTRHSTDLLVLLDLQHGNDAGEAPESALEYRITAAASVCHTAIERGQAVGMVANDAALTAIGAGRGETQRLRLLDYLATAEDSGTLPIVDVLRRHGEGWRGSGGVVVITSNRDPEWIGALIEQGARGVRHLAVMVEPGSFGAEGSSFRVQTAWRLALDWWLIRRGDDLSARRGTSRSAAL